MATFLIVDADEFELLCPNCSEPIEEIRIRRLYSDEQECPSCLGGYQLSITVENL